MKPLCDRYSAAIETRSGRDPPIAESKALPQPVRLWEKVSCHVQERGIEFHPAEDKEKKAKLARLSLKTEKPLSIS
jgi:hypothetical protein